MSALAARSVTWADPLQVLMARAEARATLYREYEISLHEAVDVLQAAAVQSGLVAELGQDAVQAVIARAFVVVGANTDADVLPDLVWDTVSQTENPVAVSHRVSVIPKATLDAAEYLVRLGQAGRMRKWLETHSAEERSAILKHLEAK